MMSAFGRHRDSGVEASFTGKGREGDADLVGLFRKNQHLKSLPNLLPKTLPTAPE
jgi:hypothetical protein